MTTFYKIKIRENDYEYTRLLTNAEYRILRELLNTHATPEGHLSYRWNGLLITPEQIRFDNVYGVIKELCLV